MNFKIIALVLVAFFLLFAGCAKKGETAEVGATTGASGGTGGSSGTGTTAGGAGATSGGTGATTGSGTTDVGNLFKIETDKPEEGSGYNVPAPSG